jgi:hypothetical protein
MPFVRRGHTTHREPLTPRQQTLLYWGIVVVLCIVAGSASFAGGKYWLGKKLHDVEARTPKGAFPDKGAVDDAATTATETPAAAEEPPDKPVVRVEAREPTEGEKTDAEVNKGAKHRKPKAKSDSSDEGKSGDETSSDKPDNPDSATKDEGSKSTDEGDTKPAKKPKKKPAAGGPTE